MPSPFVVGLRTCCMAVVLALTAGIAAESKSPPLVGATREQVLEQLGEPRSSIVAGTREVLLFERERVILRNNVVVEVDVLPAEVPRRAAAPETESEPSTAEPADQKETPETAPTEKSAPRAVAPARTPAPPSTTPPPDEGPLEIRAVRKAGTSTPRTAPRTEPAAAPTTSSSAPAAPIAPPVPTESTPREAPAQVSPAAPNTKAAEPTAVTAPPQTVPADVAAEPPDAKKADETRPAAKPAETETTAKKASRPRRDATELDAEPEVFNGRSYLIAFVIVAGGVGYLVWRSRQRTLELAATAVSRTPFAAPTTAVAGARFSSELLGKLEWKRFEDLVAAYYGKTGVVAVRTKTGPASPVHIKISWKGESRPFAYVQCIANTTGLIDAKPIQELVAALMAEDIRRGYVVTTGKFSVPARDFAEEKHITLLSGDILLEKLNALPDGARNELMQETTAGDYTTPSCPRCEGKMARSPEDPSAWRCPSHPDVTLRTST